MSTLLDRSTEYLSKSLGSKVDCKVMSAPKTLPNYFSSDYQIVQMKILGLEFIMLIEDNDLSLKPNQLMKRLSLLENELSGKFPIIYCKKSMDWYTRNKLVTNNIPFLVPDLQMYIPFIGVAFTEKFNKETKPKNTLSPATQYLFFELIGKSNEEIKVLNYENLGLSKMSINRGLNELHAIEVIDKVRKGNSVEWSLNKFGESLWKVMQEYLFNPIQSIEYVNPLSYNMDEKNGLILASESALSEMTMLGQPQKKTYAIGNRDWLKIKSHFRFASMNDDESIIIEIWKHKIPTIKGLIHPLALLLTLRDLIDERVQMSLEELYEEFDWSVE